MQGRLSGALFRSTSHLAGKAARVNPLKSLGLRSARTRALCEFKPRVFSWKCRKRANRREAQLPSIGMLASGPLSMSLLSPNGLSGH
jgi:hypothetical protein